MFGTRTLHRLRHLDEVAGFKRSEDEAQVQWNNQMIDRLLTDYMLREGYSQTAESMIEEHPMVKVCLLVLVLVKYSLLHDFVAICTTRVNPWLGLCGLRIVCIGQEDRGFVGGRLVHRVPGLVQREQVWSAQKGRKLQLLTMSVPCQHFSMSPVP